MAAQQRVLRRRIRTLQSTRKITKAMELIAASRIAKAQARRNAARPYAEELTRALSAVLQDKSLKHPMLTGVENPQRTGIVIVTSDRGLAGGYNANALRAANELARKLEGDGREVVRYVIGRKGAAYFNFRRIQLGGILDRVLRAAGVHEHPRSHREARDRAGGYVGQRHRGRHRPRRALPRLHPVQELGDPGAGDRAAGSGQGHRGHRGRGRRTTTRRTTRPRRSTRTSCTSSSRSRPNSSPRCCRATSARASSPGCSNPRRPSRRRGATR